MAGEVHGSKTRVHMHGYDMSAFLNSQSTDDSIDVADTSVFLNTAKSYIPGMSDGTFSGDGLYSYGQGNVREALEAFKALSEAVICVWPAGDAIGNPGEGLGGIETAKSVATDIGDAAKVSLAMQSKLGVESLVALHALGAESVTGNYASVDNGASSAGGGAGYLHVPDVGSTLVVKIQHSSDNVTFADLITFATVNADRVAQRVYVAGTVNRYVRAITTTLTGAPATFGVGFTRTPNRLS